MSFPKFFSFAVMGAVLWIGSLTMAGYFFGGLPIVKNNFSLVVIGIVFVSILPAVIEGIRAQREG